MVPLFRFSFFRFHYTWIEYWHMQHLLYSEILFSDGHKDTEGWLYSFLPLSSLDLFNFLNFFAWNLQNILLSAYWSCQTPLQYVY